MKELTFADSRTVRLEFDVGHTDRYGRLLVYVYVDSVLVNAELIRQGYAQKQLQENWRRQHASLLCSMN
jgi:endonuclease YncB( thermonuclease family)